jgi:hypothetical protein
MCRLKVADSINLTNNKSCSNLALKSNDLLYFFYLHQIKSELSYLYEPFEDQIRNVQTSHRPLENNSILV